jgi:type IV pilus assembly protein PilY1
VINPKTGDLIADISTPACSTTPTSSPCGLAQISGWVVGSRDNTIQYVYGGDMYGNLWRFNFTGTTIASWSVAKFAVLKDASGSTQPVTTAPELALINGNRMLFVGTGEYLGNSDIPGSTGANSASSQTQTMYGLVDSGTTLANPLRPTLQQQTLTLSGTNVTSANHTVNYTSQVGWYADMPSTGERINTDPVIAQGELVFTTNIPSSTICVPGGSSYEYFLKLSTGGLVDNSSVTWSGSFLANALASRPVPIQLPSGKVIILTRTSDNVTHANPLPGGGGATVPKRISWREIFN